MPSNSPNNDRELTNEQRFQCYAEAISACTWGRPLKGPTLLELLSAPPTPFKTSENQMLCSTPATEENWGQTSNRAADEATS